MKLLAAAIALVLAAPTLATAPAPAQVEAARAPIAAATRLARWQLARLRDTSHITRATGETANPRGWERAAFWIGMTALADAGGAPDVKAAILDMGRANGWTPGARPFHADDLAITQSYLWAVRHGAGPAARAPTRRAFDHIVSHPPKVGLAFYQPPEGYDATECLQRWCWCDALFMAPPAMLELSRQTGDARYRIYAMQEFWATTAFLFDPAQHLFYRDSRFFERRDDQQRKLFWSRGNGWVFAGLARMIPLLPKDSPDQRRMKALFVEMAARLKDLQKSDGYWSPSLLAPEGSPPEASGTAFYRQRSTGIERVTEANVARFVTTAEREAALLPRDSGYISGSDRYFEQVAAVEAVPDRLLIYQGGLLHSGVIPDGMSFSSNPHEGRLTANLFVLGD